MNLTRGRKQEDKNNIKGEWSKEVLRPRPFFTNKGGIR